MGNLLPKIREQMRPASSKPHLLAGPRCHGALPQPGSAGGTDVTAPRAVVDAEPPAGSLDPVRLHEQRTWGSPGYCITTDLHSSLFLLFCLIGLSLRWGKTLVYSGNVQSSPARSERRDAPCKDVWAPHSGSCLQILTALLTVSPIAQIKGQLEASSQPSQGKGTGWEGGLASPASLQLWLSTWGM